MLERWRERAIRIDRDGPSEEDRILLRSYRTCALSEVLDQFPFLQEKFTHLGRVNGMGPEDPTLRFLSASPEFFDAIKDRQLGEYLDKIEDRVLELKREVGHA